MGRKRQVTVQEEARQEQPAREPEKATQEPPRAEGPAPEPPKDDGAPRAKLSDVIRAALGALGNEATTAEVKNWISREYPGYLYNQDSLASSLSTLKKKLAGAVLAERPRQTVSRPSPLVPPAPTVDDLLRVKQVADENGGVEELLKAVQAVSDLANDVGGIETLLKCLVTLHKLIGR